jgi:hypothetical protein
MVVVERNLTTMTRIILLLFILFPAFAANPELLTNTWPAQWAYPADGDPFGYGVYHYRK